MKIRRIIEQGTERAVSGDSPFRCACIGLRTSDPEELFITVPLTSSIPEWRKGWFYVDNTSLPCLPPYSGERIPEVDSWRHGPVEADRRRIELAIARIRILWDRELSDRLVGRCFLQWRLQLLAARSRLLSSFSGHDGPTG
jgi:hypothetical protein